MITGLLSAILILMLIYGLYSIISGKFGLRKNSLVEGRPARMAGLIFILAPLFYVLIISAAEIFDIKKSDANEIVILIVVPLLEVIGGLMVLCHIYPSIARMPAQCNA